MGKLECPAVFFLFSLIFILGSLSLLPICTAEVAVNQTHTTRFLSPTESPAVHRLTNVGGFGLVPEPTIILDYHSGPVMSGRNDKIKIFVTFYGTFSPKQRSTLRLFLRSFWNGQSRVSKNHPTVANWWQITHNYVDLYNTPVARNLLLAGDMTDKYSLGKDLLQSDIQKLVLKSMKKFEADARSMYLVLTSEDVLVEKFCMSVCGTHYYTFPSAATNGQMVPYGWVGNPASQCPGLCSWPYSAGGFLTKGLIPPNGDVGVDGMIITVANLLAGIATNPFGNGFYQPDGLEAVGACQGIYGTGSYPGYPGELLVDSKTGASFNVFGSSNSKFLVPRMWNPATLLCAGQV